MSLPAYAEYKDSGVEWLGDVPKHWFVLKISRIFEIKAGGDLKPEFFSETKDELHPYPIYTNSVDENFVYGYTSKNIFPANTVTVTGRGGIGYA
ncbi:MAG: restriction endonuclease subunit S, partial [Moraxellaceae bacterium]